MTHPATVVLDPDDVPAAVLDPDDVPSAPGTRCGACGWGRYSRTRGAAGRVVCVGCGNGRPYAGD